MRAPDDADRRKDDLVPRLAVLRQARAGDPHERLEPVAQTRGHPRRLRLQVAVIQPF